MRPLLARTPPPDSQTPAHTFPTHTRWQTAPTPKLTHQRVSQGRGSTRLTGAAPHRTHSRHPPPTTQPTSLLHF
jgi:hypothetical protein